MTEIWKPLIGLDDIVDNRYVVSSMGRIIDTIRNVYLNANDNGAGYKTSPFRSKCGNLRVRYVHRVVAYVFLDNPECKPQVGHKDHCRDNNTVHNLYWTTQKENTRDGIEAGRINAKKRPNTKKLTKAQVCEIALLSTKGFGVNEIAVTLGFPRTTISSVFNGRSNWHLFQFALEEIKTSQTLLDSLSKP